MTLKKVSAIFVSAALAMAMLVGCGSGSVGDQLRDETDAGAKAEVNQVAITLAEKESVEEANVQVAVKNVIGSTDEIKESSTDAGNEITEVAVTDEDGNAIGTYYAFIATGSDEDALVADVTNTFNAIQKEAGADTDDMYIAASAIDEDKVVYVIVVYVDQT